MSKNVRRMLLIVLAIVFAGSVGKMLQQANEYHQAEKLYRQAAELSVQGNTISDADLAPDASLLEPDSAETDQDPLEENAQFLMQINLENLRKTNQDVLGWIYVPDSAISYPLMKVKNNQEYLRRSWDGTPNQAGCIFLESKNYRDFRDFNSIIFGHYMNNGTMFGSLHRYKEQEYWDSHPFIYIVTDSGVRRYQVFATYEAGVQSDTYRLYFEDDARKQSVLDYYMESSVIKSDLTPTVEDRILTLSTCTEIANDYSRWVVQAVLTGEFLCQ